MRKLFMYSLIAISLLSISSCGEKIDSEVLVANQWKLESLSSVEDVKMPQDDSFTLSFDTVENRVFGTANCNLYFADYELGESNTIIIGQPGATMMMCHEDNAEMQFLDMLEEAYSFRVIGESLELLSKDNAILSVFATYIPEQE